MKRELDTSTSSTEELSSTYKRLKNDLNLLFPGTNSSPFTNVHTNCMHYDELMRMEESVCSSFLETLKLHGFHRVVRMPKEFVNACNDLYNSSKTFFSMDESYKSMHFPEKDVETGYKCLKEREYAFFRKGYLPDNKNNDAAKDLATKFETYYNEACKVSVVVFNAIVKALGGNIEQARNILPLTETDVSTNVVRAFNYFEAAAHTVTCVAHLDIGLLTIVPANCPGLQAYSMCGNCGMGWETTHKGMDATDIIVICGQTLTEFSNGAIAPGLHRVVSEPNTSVINPSAESSGDGKKPKAKKGKKADSKQQQNLQQPLLKPKVGRVSLPFILRAKNEAQMSGGLIGLTSFARGPSGIVGDFLEAERKKRLPGLY